MFVINAEKRKILTFSEVPLNIWYNTLFHINNSGYNQMINLKMAISDRSTDLEASLINEDRWVKLGVLNNSNKDLQFLLPSGYKLRTKNGSSDVSVVGYVEIF